VINVIGYTAGFLTTAALVPQLLKTWKTKSANDLSLGMLWTFNLGIISWLTYGILSADKPLILWNTITMFMASLILIMKLKYR
jgi:MtN3 and saliva related transmembrane protein